MSTPRLQVTQRGRQKSYDKWCGASVIQKAQNKKKTNKIRSKTPQCSIFIPYYLLKRLHQTPNKIVLQGKEIHGMTVTESGFQAIEASNPLKDASIKQSLQKWGFGEQLKIMQYTYKKPYHKMSQRELALDFLNDINVAQWWQNSSAQRARVSEVEIEQIPCQITSTKYFNKLNEGDPQITRKGQSGQTFIVGCYQDEIKGYEIINQLRALLLDEDCENYQLYSDNDRKEFIFQLFQSMVLGGPMNQYEDTLDPYVQCAVKLYKQLLCVRKNPKTNEAEILSRVYKLNNIECSDGSQLFPNSDTNNFCFLCVDPVRRRLNVVYSANCPIW